MTTASASPRLCSVIVPVYNGAATIEDCLDALAAQTLPPQRFEVIVVDDGSTDDTPLVVDNWLGRHPSCAHWRCVRQQNQGPGAARNHGARLAQTPLLLFTDADCAPTPHWVASLLAAFQPGDPAGEVAGAKGAYLTDQTGWTPQFVQAEYEDRYDRMRNRPRIDFVDTYSAAYQRDVFLASGGFDTTFTTASVEDQELSFRLAGQGQRLVFVPAAQVKHIHDRTPAEYFRRKYAIGYWKALVTRWHPERMLQDSHTPQSLKLQMVLWLMILGLLPVALLGGLVWRPLALAWWLILLLLGAFLLSTLPFLGKLARRSWRLALLGPFLLAVRSVALGLGYLVGVLHFAGTRPRTPRADARGF